MEKERLILCDSDVLIELIDRKNEKIFANCLKFGFTNICISSISFSELICGSLNAEHQLKLIKELDKFILCDLNPTIDKIHHDLIVRYALSHGMKVQDALISATCLFFQMPLYTLNAKDFRFIEGLELI
ncbi:MAG: PIN domain-containing protein [Cyclobacteriaceae bacterium]|jgi:tRNA(fMet)-specific endonuclease VapC